eukprot:jgi/Orpsp1_1/1176339/evm.model.c7180000057245.2
MRLNIYKIVLYLIFISITFCIPIETEIKELDISTNNISINKINKSLTKRIDYGIYFQSFGNFFLSKNIKHNVFYKTLRNLDIYYDKKDITKKPVVIYIYGGTWYMGEKSIYSKLGDFLRENGYVAVIPNYIQFPYGKVNNMIKDIRDAIIWVYNNIERYHGDVNNITILGHSSGAHLSMLTLLKASHKVKIHGNAIKYIDPLPMFQRMVLLNGPYDFDVFTDLSKKTGITEENSNFEKFVSSILGSECPTDILKKYKNKSIKSLSTKRIEIVHTSNDNIVPLSSATGLFLQIKRTTNVPVDLYMAEGFYHCGITEGVMNGVKKAQDFLLKIL